MGNAQLNYPLLHKRKQIQEVNVRLVVFAALVAAVGLVGVAGVTYDASANPCGYVSGICGKTSPF